MTQVDITTAKSKSAFELQKNKQANSHMTELGWLGRNGQFQELAPEPQAATDRINWKKGFFTDDREAHS